MFLPRMLAFLPTPAERSGAQNPIMDVEDIGRAALTWRAGHGRIASCSRDAGITEHDAPAGDGKWS